MPRAVVNDPCMELAEVLGALPWSGHDLVAALSILVGVAFQVIQRRLPRGLGTSLFVCGTTVGAAVAAFHHNWLSAGGAYLASHIASGLCLTWALFGFIAAKRGRPGGDDSARSSSEVFFAWSLVAGVAAAVLISHMLVFATWDRLVDTEASARRVEAAGLLNFVALLAATGLWAGAGRRPHQPALLLAETAMLVWWTGLMIPTIVGSDRAPATTLRDFQPLWWTWTLQLQFGLAALLVGAAVMQDAAYRRRQDRSWPDRPELLTLPYSRWPAYIQIESIVAAAVLIVGVWQLVRPGPGTRQIGLAGAVLCLVAGVTCMFMCYRRWSGNTAGLGMALVTLAAVSFAAAISTAFAPEGGRSEYVRTLPVRYNAVLVALTVMAGWWSWLAGFWRQQLLDGIPWTTAGRMIPFARRTSFLVIALAVLVAYQMTLWPDAVYAADQDATAGRLAAGVGGIALLTIVSLWLARAADSTAGAALAVAAASAGVLFVFIRLPPSDFRGWIVQHEPLVFGSIAAPLVLAADLLGRTRWRCVATPLWYLAVLILPAWALIGLTFEARLPAAWVRPATLAILGAVYGFVAGHERRRVFLLVSAALLLAAAFSLFRSFG